HFILLPRGHQPSENQKHLNHIFIEPGISFGSGRHPTTRLCLEAIDIVFFQKRLIPLKTKTRGADIGTGSGVLAMAMCFAGLSSCEAYDIDPNCVAEAKRNVTLNGLDQRIQIIDSEMVKTKALSIICANLRFPTLKHLSDLFYSSLNDKGVLVLSGIRSWEKEELTSFYLEKGFERTWHKDEKNWSSLILVKNHCFPKGNAL
ncbi:MAG: methyltransferase, partial [Desulfobacteraceae bacterium]|nr:methyltransferase [Desulfobacteraceae bacterium]